MLILLIRSNIFSLFPGAAKRDEPQNPRLVPAMPFLAGRWRRKITLGGRFRGGGGAFPKNRALGARQGVRSFRDADAPRPQPPSKSVSPTSNQAAELSRS